jgi:hypothetical protein
MQLLVIIKLIDVTAQLMGIKSDGGLLFKNML